MVFSSVVFLFFFLPAVLLIYYSLPSIQLKNIFLLIASLFFYSWGEPVFVFVMLFSCLLNYIFGLLLNRYSTQQWPLIIGVSLNLLVLVIAKYSDFFVHSVNPILPEGYQLSAPNIPLPIGISFFTFQAISYLVDVNRKQAHVQKNPLRLSLYVALFPQLIAGPIVRYHHVASELHRRVHHIGLFSEGVKRFIIGLGKKVIIANSMGQLTDAIMNQPDSWNSSVTWLGMLAYTLQIYFDFSGYSDMAIGLGKMFGFNFHENFNFPYQSKSIQEFWRRWHISLSTWFRDYLYIPLGGNRRGVRRTYANLLTVFFLTGLWHGASWNFVFWGLFHGFFLLIERIGFGKILKKMPILGHIYTILVVMIGWMLFRLEHFSDFIAYMQGVFSFSFSNVSDLLSKQQALMMILGILFSVKWISKPLNISPKWKKITVPAYQLVLLVLFVLCCLDIATSTYNPFIYYRF
ncbi:MAG: membrane-bound O-acyltransferase family protein [Crocinitomicaceae bacterium]|nr:membrane-bound O-acyltransferase family protein [Crocinitomicaceae bacterium]